MTQSKEPEQHNRQSSPVATGGGGHTFEHKVQTSLLAYLLVRAQVPFTHCAWAEELGLQTEHLGYSTDDARLVALDDKGVSHRQLWAIKRTLKFTKSDADFQQVVGDAWDDFCNSELFERTTDVIVFATSKLAVTYVKALSILQIARATNSAMEFYQRLENPGYVSAKAKDYLELIRQLCVEHAKEEISTEELWAFCRCLYVVDYDFDQPSGRDEARMKTLLAMAARDGSGTTGNDLWNRLFAFIADADPQAQTLKRDQLPNELLRDSKPVSYQYESGVISRLLEHSQDVCRRIRMTVGGGIQLPRTELINKLGESITQEQFTLIIGKAGTGKSASALMSLQHSVPQAPIFAFQAAEFARDSLDEALSDLRIMEPIQKISALFALHPIKYLLIDSVERLLESQHRDAFFDLLNRLKDDPSWHIVLTCRLYGSAQVREAFLAPLRINYSEISVPLLTDAELQEIIANTPNLESVVENPRIRDLLRNLSYLAKACEVDWQNTPPETLIDAKALRQTLWRQVVERSSIRGDGIYLRRMRCFCDIAIDRARSLQSFVSWQQGDEQTVESLISDDLLVEEPSTHRVAPSDDVLEDWAVMCWIENTYRDCEGIPASFFTALGYELPIRRGYRLWLQEGLESSISQQIGAFADDVLKSGISDFWKDETLVSIMLSEQAAQYIQERQSALLDNKHTLKQLVHLIRTACVVPSLWLGLSGEMQLDILGDYYLVPDGPAWHAILKLISDNLEKFDEQDLTWIFGVLEDFKNSISIQNPNPNGTREAGLVALHYWYSLSDDYNHEGCFNRLAPILISTSNAINEEFHQLLTKEMLEFRDPIDAFAFQFHQLLTETPSQKQSVRSSVLEKKLLSSLEGSSAYKSHSKDIALLAERYWGLYSPPSAIQPDTFDIDIDKYFGLNVHSHDYYPASALQGPFYAMLHVDIKTGIDLILSLVNFCTDRYVHLGLLDKGTPTQLTFSLGPMGKTKQWSNRRLWLMYRGGMPGPDLLQSALMALEGYLLEIVKQGQNLQQLAEYLILGSKSVSVTAVLASVAMAYPNCLGNTVLTLLRTPEIFALDKNRWVGDKYPFTIAEWAYSVEKRVYASERAASDKLPHRNENMENLTIRLQTGPLRDEVWKILDQYKVQLPDISVQTESDKLWRLLLHRIDLRNFVIEKETEDHQLIFMPGPPDSDIQEIIDRNTPELENQRLQYSLFNWAQKNLSQTPPDDAEDEKWKEMLSLAQEIASHTEKPEIPEPFTNTSVASNIAAACVANHWHDLASEDRKWCRTLLVPQVMINKDTRVTSLQISQQPLAAPHAAAQVLPMMFTEPDGKINQDVREAITIGITHAVAEMRQLTAKAIGEYLWIQDADFAYACIEGLLQWNIVWASIFHAPRSSEDRICKPFDTMWESVIRIRSDIVSSKSIQATRTNWDDFEIPFVPSLLSLVAHILTYRHKDPLAQKLVLRMTKSLVTAWKKSLKQHDQRDYESEAELQNQLVDYLTKCDATVAIKLWEPFILLLSGDVKKFCEVFRDLIATTDQTKNSTVFWAIWEQTLSVLMKCDDWDKLLTGEETYLDQVVGMLLLDGVLWKTGVEDWEPIHDHKSQLRELVLATGTNPHVCEAYIRLLYSVGRTTLLPEGLIWLDSCLEKGNPQKMIGTNNSITSLTRILAPLVYGQTRVLRESSSVREAILRILGHLIELGSSSAYRMREFVITPVTPIVRS